MTLYLTCLSAYLSGWLIVNLFAARWLRKVTRSEARLAALKDEYQNGLAEKIVDELERRAKAPRHTTLDTILPVTNNQEGQ